MGSAPGTVALTARELNLFRKLLTAQAARIRAEAPAAVSRQPHRLVREAMADIQELAASNCDDLAGRLSFAAALPPDTPAVITIGEVA